MNQTLSKSPLSGVSYPVPTLGDSEGIKNFISGNNSPVVAVQGLGFVGFVMSLVVASSQKPYAVIGVDKNSIDAYWKIPEINNGICPIVSSDPLVSELFETSLEQGNFYATHDSNAFKYADVIIVDINLDVTKENNSDRDLLSFDVPLKSFKKAIESIGRSCKEDVLILVETTVPPGTCRKIVYPIIVENLKSRGLDTNKFKLGHSYERVMPGPNYVNSIKNFYRVYSGINLQSADAVEKFLKTVISTDEYPLTRLKTTESTEMAKVLENSYRAMNISFAIEWSRFAENSGVDLYEVVDAIRLRPTHSNLMYPGIGVGGYCLTKDPLMASWASQHFFGLEEGLQSSVQAVVENDKMPMYCFDYVIKILTHCDKKNTRIGFLGVAYGPGIGDTRFSASVSGGPLDESSSVGIDHPTNLGDGPIDVIPETVRDIVWEPLGLTVGLQFLLLGCGMGTLLGGSQGLARSIFGQMVPETRSAEFFGFFGFFGKVAAFIGPLMYATLTVMYGSRVGVFCISLLILIGAYMMRWVDVDDGRAAARAEDARNRGIAIDS